MKKYSIMIATLLGMTMHSVNAQPNKPITGSANAFVYSVKFLCGLQPNSIVRGLPLPAEPPVKAGNYATSVNIHNYHLLDTPVSIKAVISNGQIGQLMNRVMIPNQAINIDCAQIYKMLPAPLPGFIEGFVEINSNAQLSVAGVYTSRTCSTSSAGTCTVLGEVSLDVVPQQSFTDQ